MAETWLRVPRNQKFQGRAEGPNDGRVDTVTRGKDQEMKEKWKG